MAVIKLKKDNMSKNSKKRKPTKQDFVNVINRLIQDVEYLHNNQQALNGTLDLYIRFKKESDEFNAYVKTELEKMKSKEDNELQSAGQDNTVSNTADSTN